MSRTTRTRRTADQWRALINEQAGSGLSQEAFCEQHGHIWTAPCCQAVFRPLVFSVGRVQPPPVSESSRVLIVAIRKGSADIYPGSWWSRLLAPAQHEFRDDPGAYTGTRLFTFVQVQVLPGS